MALIEIAGKIGTSSSMSVGGKDLKSELKALGESTKTDDQVKRITLIGNNCSSLPSSDLLLVLVGVPWLVHMIMSGKDVSPAEAFTLINSINEAQMKVISEIDKRLPWPQVALCDKSQ